MRKTLLSVLAAALLAPMTLAAGENITPEREMRSTWVATVWRLDWPQTVITSTGNATQIAKQKQEMITMLDSLALNNFNAINFQVRSRSDAMYRSSYEPWSSDLVSERGMDPGYDPLEFVVQECHKRGLECHAWVNPYRFESVSHAWDGTPQNYRDTHPDWVMDVASSSGSASILNPGLPEVTERICDIIKEIVANYDVDGVLFDDYFYLSGTTTEHDGDLYNAYKAAGGTLSIGDWRRSNVNAMIAAVNAAIKSVKPWVRFGVSPAGIACTSASVARKYGIRPCPTGSDWQYSSIYSDPIAWVSEQSLDFISPQIYWTRAASTAYGPATEWWSEVANKWGRHLFVSHSISSLTASSKVPGLSSAESDKACADAPERASGAGNETFQEYAEQIYLNREYNLDNAPGSIFYSAKYLYRIAPKFSHFLRNKAFTTSMLPPAMPWLSVAAPAPVENVALSGTRLTWKEVPGMRYTVYAYPAGTNTADMLRTPDYLLGMCYEPSYTLADKYASGYTVGVCAFDRYGNESTLTLPGEPAGTLAAPVLGTPAVSASIEAPFDFTWTPVENAIEYIVEVATNPDMSGRIDQRSATTASISSNAFRELPLDCTLYWRVRACAPGYRDGASASAPFTVTQLRIDSPEPGMAATLCPHFAYSIADREVTLEISTDAEFGEADIVYTHTHAGSHTVAPYALRAATEYYARARYERNGEPLVSAMVAFTTPDVEHAVPSIALPVAGGDFYADSHLTLAPVEGPKQLRVEVSATTAFSQRKIYFNSLVDTRTFTDPNQGSEIKIQSKELTDGATYYVRARAVYSTLEEGNVTTDYCDPVPFVYRSQNSGIEAPEASGAFAVEERTIIASQPLTVLRPDGRAAATLEAGQSATLDPGVYLIKVQAGATFKTVLR